MRFTFFIALRYLFAKKSNNIINWISGISVASIAVVTAALIIILSAMNGLSDTVMKMYSDFDPDLKVTATKGKFFKPNEELIKNIKEINGVNNTVLSVEETVLIKYRDNQEVAVIKGVSDDFKKTSRIENHIIEGFYSLTGGGREMCVIGIDLAYKLGVNTALPQPIGIFVPDMNSNIMFSDDFFKSVHPKPVGIFDINTDFNKKYILTSINLAKGLLNLKKEVSAIEIDINEQVKVEDVKDELIKIIGNDYDVKTRFEQNEFLFKSINTEKWITLLILSLIVILAIFNVISSLTMLIIDKKKDIFILQSMGAKIEQIKFIFWLEGCLIALLGATIGTIIGISACYAQQVGCFFGYGSVGKIECFPIIIETFDIIITFSVVFGIAAIFTLLPALRIKITNTSALP